MASNENFVGLKVKMMIIISRTASAFATLEDVALDTESRGLLKCTLSITLPDK